LAAAAVVTDWDDFAGAGAACWWVVAPGAVCPDAWILQTPNTTTARSAPTIETLRLTPICGTSGIFYSAGGAETISA
jgi:hypothetical protein